MITVEKTTINLRLADFKDVGMLEELDELFKDYKIPGVDLDKERITLALHNMIEKKGTVLCFIDDVLIGGCAGEVMESNFTKDRQYTIYFNFIKEEYRQHTQKFMRGLEQFLRLHGVNRFSVAVPEFSPNPQTHERFYKMLGFKKLETHYSKEL